MFADTCKDPDQQHSTTQFRIRISSTLPYGQFFPTMTLPFICRVAVILIANLLTLQSCAQESLAVATPSASSAQSFPTDIKSEPANDTKEPDEEAKPSEVERFEADTGLNHRWMQRVAMLDDGTLLTNRSYVHIEPGLNYLDEDGVLRESEELIEITPEGAEARFGQIKVRFSPDITTSGAIEVQSPSGNQLRGAPLGLSYYDAKSGQSVLIAEAKSTIGELVPPNRIVYKDFLDDVAADVVYEYKRSGFMQLVLIKQPLPPPSFYGLSDENSRLEVMTEFLTDKQPRRTIETIKSEVDVAKRATMVEPDFKDEFLAFEGMAMPRGKAFGIKLDDSDPSSQQAVGKHWQDFAAEGRSVLFESVEYQAVKPHFDALPAKAEAEEIEAKPRAAASKRTIPGKRLARVAAKPLHVAMADYEGTGVAIDWVGVPNGGVHIVFQSGVTYFVATDTSYFDSATFGSGTVIKLQAGASLRIRGGSSMFGGSAGDPTIITARDDDYFGELIGNGTGHPYQTWYGNPALDFMGQITGSSNAPTGFRIRYAFQGIRIAGNDPISHSLKNTLFENCSTAVVGDGSTVLLENIKICNVGNLKTGAVQDSQTNPATVDCSDTLYPYVAPVSMASSVASPSNAASAARDLDPNTWWRSASPPNGEWIAVGTLVGSAAAFVYFPPVQPMTPGTGPAAAEGTSAILNYRLWALSSPPSSTQRAADWQGQPVLGQGSWTWPTGTASRKVKFPALQGTASLVLENTQANISSAAAAEIRVFHTHRDVPGIQGAVNQTINNSGISGQFPLYVTDWETHSDDLKLELISTSDPSKIPSAGIVFGGGGPNRWIQFTPVYGAIGATTIHIKVTDGHGAVTTAQFVVNVIGSPLATPVLTKTFSSDHANVTISGQAQSGSTIYYTLDGSDPTTSSLTTLPSQFTSAVSVRARAFQTGYSPSAIAVLSVGVSSGVTFSPNGDGPASFETGPLGVQLTCTEPGATVYYLRGAGTTLYSTAPNSTITLYGLDTGYGTLQAYAYSPNTLKSPTVTSQEYSFRIPQPTAVVGYDQAAGNATVTLSSLGSSIYYLVAASGNANASVPPNGNNVLYSSANKPTFTSGGRLSARAYRNGYVASGPITVTINQLPAPKIATSAGLLSADLIANNDLNVWLLPNFGFENPYGEQPSTPGNTIGWSNADWVGNDTPSIDFPGAFTNTGATLTQFSGNKVGARPGSVYSMRVWLKAVTSNTKAYAGVAAYNATTTSPIGAEDVGGSFFGGSVSPISYLTSSLSDGNGGAALANIQIFSPISSDQNQNIFVPLLSFSRTLPIATANQPDVIGSMFQSIPLNSQAKVYGLDPNYGLISFLAPWLGGSVSANTLVARRVAGDAHQYKLGNNQIIPTTWTEYQASGFSDLRPGTEQVALVAQLAWQSGSSAKVRMTGMEFWEGTVAEKPKLYYTTDGSTAVFSQSAVEGPKRELLTGNTPGQSSRTISLRQRGARYLDSPLVQRTITFTAADPVVTIEPHGPDWTGNGYLVTVTCQTAGAEIRYTLDGTTPTETSSKKVPADGKVILNSIDTPRWRAFRTGYNPSGTVTSAPIAQLATPTRSVEGCSDPAVISFFSSSAFQPYRVYTRLPNLVDVSVWTATSEEPSTVSGQVGAFVLEGGAQENALALRQTPHKNQRAVWIARHIQGNGTDSYDGGWRFPLDSIDTSKTYRFSVWVKRVGGTTGRAYVSCGGNAVVVSLNDPALQDGHFWYENHPGASPAGSLPLDQWHLVVGYVHPLNYQAPQGYSGGKVYHETGTTIVNNRADFRWNASSVSGVFFRVNAAYANADDPAEYQFWDPRVEVVPSTSEVVDVLFVPVGSLQQSDSGGQFTVQVPSGSCKQVQAYSSEYLTPPVFTECAGAASHPDIVAPNSVYYQENDVKFLLMSTSSESSVKVTDAGPGTFAQGTVTVGINAGFQSGQDQLGFYCGGGTDSTSGGSGYASFSLKNGKLYLNGTEVADAPAGLTPESSTTAWLPMSASSLTFTLSSAASLATADAILKNILYRNTSDAPNTGQVRTVSISVQKNEAACPGTKQIALTVEKLPDPSYGFHSTHFVAPGESINVTLRGGDADCSTGECSVTYGIASQSGAGSFSGPSGPNGNEVTYVAPTISSFSSAVNAGKLEYSVNDGSGQLAGAGTVTVYVGPGDAPTVYAGPDRTIFAGDSFTLVGWPDTIPNGEQLTWSAVSGPATVQFSPADQPVTFASGFALPGVYTLRFTRLGPGGPKSDDLTVTVLEVPNITAGPDRNVTSGSVLAIDGTTTSPTSLAPAYQWYLVNGPSGFNLNPNPGATLSFPGTATVGRYEFRLIARLGNAIRSDEVVVQVLPQAIGRTWTRDADFEEGYLLNTTYEEKADELTLSASGLNAAPMSAIIANVESVSGTKFARFDSDTGALVGWHDLGPTPSGSGFTDFWPASFVSLPSGDVLIVGRRNNDEHAGPAIIRMGIVVGGTRVSSPASLLEDPAGEYLRPPFRYSTLKDRMPDGVLRTRGSWLLDNWTSMPTVQQEDAALLLAQDETLLAFRHMRDPLNANLPALEVAASVDIDSSGYIWVTGTKADHKLRLVKLNPVDLLVEDTFDPTPVGLCDWVIADEGLPRAYFDNEGQLIISLLNGSAWARYSPQQNVWSCPGNSLPYFFPLTQFPRSGASREFGVNSADSTIWFVNQLDQEQLVELTPGGTAWSVLSYPHTISSAGATAHAGAVMQLGSDNDVWVAPRFQGLTPSIARFSSAGQLVGRFELQCLNPLKYIESMGIDGRGRIWANGSIADGPGSDGDPLRLVRIDPNRGPLAAPPANRPTGAVDLVVSLPITPFQRTFLGQDATHRNRNRGTWNAVHDAGASVGWGQISWRGNPGAGSISVRARTSEYEEGLPASTWVPVVVNGSTLGQSGRFIEVEVTLTGASGGAKPVLEELTVLPSQVSQLTLPTTGQIALDDKFTISYMAPNPSIDPPPAVPVQVLDVLKNDSHPDQLILQDRLGQPLHGSVKVVNQKVEYLPRRGYSGEDRFTYTVKQPDGILDRGLVRVQVSLSPYIPPALPPNPDSLPGEYEDWRRNHPPVDLVGVCAPPPVSRHPIARDDSKAMRGRALASDANEAAILVLANDSDDPTAPTPRIDLVDDFPRPTRFGEVRRVGDALMYQPSVLAYGTDTFSYRIRNSDGGESTAKVTIQVAPVDPPAFTSFAPALNGTSGDLVFTLKAGKVDTSSFSASAPYFSGLATGPLLGGQTGPLPPLVSPQVVKIEFYNGERKLGEILNPTGTQSGLNLTYGGTFKWAHVPSGSHPLRAVATDAMGLSGSSEVMILAGPNLTSSQPPVASIDGFDAADYDTLPASNSTAAQADPAAGGSRPRLVKVGRPNLYYQVSDANGGTLFYQLLLYRTDGALIANVTPGTLTDGYSSVNVTPTTAFASSARLDLTVLQNGSYVLELNANDGGTETSARFPFVLRTGLKLGQFSFEEEDTLVNTGELPLRVVRRYDSSKRSDSDFGPGWSYALFDLDVEINEEREPAQEASTGEYLSVRVGGGRDVTLTLPDGRRTTFLYHLEGPVLENPYAFQAAWMPEPGVTARLTSLSPGDNDEVGDNTIFGLPAGLVYWQPAGQTCPQFNFDFPGFRLHLQDGTVYTIERESFARSIDEKHGHWFESSPGRYDFVPVRGKARVSSVKLPNKEEITVQPSQVDHRSSSGAVTRSLVFERGVGNRIVAVREVDSGTTSGVPKPALVRYEYDGLGNLVYVHKLQTYNDTTKETRYATTTYVYDAPSNPHYLGKIIDARGVEVARNVYENGKLAKITSPDGTDTAFTYTSVGSATVDSAQTIEVKRGTVKVSATTHEMDTRGNIVKTTDAQSNETSRQFDSVRNFLTQEAITPAGGGSSLVTGYTYQMSTANPNFVQRRETTRPGNAWTIEEFEAKRGRLIKSVDANHATTPSMNVDSATLYSLNQYDDDPTHPTPGTGQLWRVFARGTAPGTSQDDPLSQNEYYPSNDANEGLLKESQDALKNRTVYEYYDGVTGPGRAGDLKDVIQYPPLTAPNSSVALSWTSYTYDVTTGQRLTETRRRKAATGTWNPTVTPDDATTSYEYDSARRVMKTIDPEGGVATTSYNMGGQVAETTDRYGATTRYAYDAMGRRVQTEYPDQSLARSAEFYLITAGTPGNPDTATRQQIQEDRHFRTDPLSAISGTRTTFDSLGRAIKVERLKNLSIAYELNGEVAKTTFVSGDMVTTTQTKYDFAGRVEMTQDANGKWTKHEFDDFGRVWRTRAFVDMDGLDIAGVTLTTLFDYDPNGNQKWILDPNHYAAITGWPTPVTAASWRNYVFGDDTRRTHLTQFNYDHFNRRDVVTHPAVAMPSGPKTYTQRTVYDVAGRRLRESLPAELESQYIYTGFGYDDSGRLSSVTNAFAKPDQTLTKYSYDELGQLKEQRDARNNATVFSFDSTGRRSTRTLPASTAALPLTERWIRNVGGSGPNQSDVRVDFAGRAMLMRRDTMGRTVEKRPLLSAALTGGITGSPGTKASGAINPPNANNALKFEASSAGTLDNGKVVILLPADAELPDSTPVASYDSINRVLLVRYRTTSSTANQILAAAAGSSAQLTVTLDSTAAGDSGNNGSGLAGVGPQDGSWATFEYTASGQRSRIIDNKDTSPRTTRYVYDELDRLRIKSMPEGTLTYDYFADGQLRSISARNQYNFPADPPYALGSILASPILATGNTAANPSGLEVTYAYDSRARLWKVNPDDPNSSASPADAIYTYDAVGNVAKLKYRNGVESTYTYNALNQLRRVQGEYVSASNTRTELASFDYDDADAGDTLVWPAERTLAPSGQRRGVQERLPGASLYPRMVAYSYDNLQRLTREELGTGSFVPGSQGVNYGAYDPVGNRSQRLVTDFPAAGSQALASQSSLVYDANDRLSTETSDPNGNVLRGDTIGDNTVEQVADDVYDRENRLIRSQTSAAVITLVYDGDGHRVRKVAGTSYTWWLVDDRNPTGYPQVVEERVTSGAAPRVTLSSTGVAVPMPTALYVLGTSRVLQNRGNVLRYYGLDGLGSVRYLSTPAGVVQDTYTYDAYGNLIARSARATSGGAQVSFTDLINEATPSGSLPTPNWYRFAAYQYDADLKRYFLNARYYNPQSGRFWTMDSFEGSQSDPLSLHKYLYAHANPVNRIDPSGHNSFSTAGMLTVNAISFGMNAWSAGANIRAGNYGRATLDIVGAVAAGFGLGGGIPPGMFPRLATAGGIAISGAQVARAGNVGRGLATVAAAWIAEFELISAMSSSGNSTAQGVQGGQGPLTEAEKEVFRQEGRNVWQQVTGRRAKWDGLDVHHRIPLEWWHLFFGNPNRLSNITGVPTAVHWQVTAEWNAWRQALNGRAPSANEVLDQMVRIEQRFGAQFKNLVVD